MAELSIKPMNVTEFLKWEQSQPEAPRFELVDGVPCMMSPEKIRHTDVKGAVYVALGRAIGRLPNSNCRVFTEGVTVPILEHSSYKPDISVYCGDHLDDNDIFIQEPLIIVEVLSPSTKAFDKGGKLIGYFSLPSLVHYLLVDPLELTVEHHTRAGGEITKQILTDGTLTLNPPGFEVQVSELFTPSW